MKAKHFFGHRLTHCAFADDMTLIARNWTSMKRMLAMVRRSLAQFGLTLHPSKCKVQTNRIVHFPRGATHIEEGFEVEILLEGEGLPVLGTVLHLDDPTKHEIANRIATGWRMFWGMGKLLMNKEICLKQRLRVFESTVSSCVL